MLSKFSQLSLRTKMLCAFGLVSLVGIAGMFTLKAFNEYTCSVYDDLGEYYHKSYEAVLNEKIAVIEAVRELRLLTVGVHTANETLELLTQNNNSIRIHHAEAKAKIEKQQVAGDMFSVVIEEEKALDEKLLTAWKPYTAAQQNLAALLNQAEEKVKQNDVAGIKQLLVAEINPVLQSYQQAFVNLKQQEIYVSDALMEAADKRVAETANLLWLFIVGALVVALVIGFYFSQWLSGSVHGVVNNVQKVGSNSQQVNTAGQTIATKMNSLASGSHQLASSVKQTSIAMQQLATASNDIAKSASQSTQHTRAVENSITKTNNVIAELQQAAQQITNVVDTIYSIAAQTNLLSLNATIEAASAGDAGKGFAVVANEVKQLAAQSAQASQEIRGKVQHIQNSIEAVGSSMTDMTEAAGR